MFPCEKRKSNPSVGAAAGEDDWDLDGTTLRGSEPPGEDEFEDDGADSSAEYSWQKLAKSCEKTNIYDFSQGGWAGMGMGKNFEV